jgi:antitoxin MazE
MNTIVRSKLIKIGNSQGIRIPKPLLEQTGLKNEVEMIVQGDKLIIQAPHKPRQGWEAQFASMSAHQDDQLLDELTPTTWDEEEWTW